MQAPHEGIRVVVVEDDPVQCQLLRSYIARVPEIADARFFHEPEAAKAHIRDSGADLILLDIGLPGMSGFDLLGQLERHPLFVITTGDPGHALQGFERGAVDLLVKPFTLERFIKSIRRSTSRMGTPLHEPVAEAPNPGATAPLVFRSGSRTLRIPPESILMAEALGNHVRLHLEGRTLVVNATTKAVELMLAEHGFIRVHRTRIVARNAITALVGDSLLTTLGEVPVGGTFRQQVQRFLDLRDHGDVV